MRLLERVTDRICGQPDMLEHSRHEAIRQMLEIPEEKPERPPVVAGERIEA